MKKEIKENCNHQWGYRAIGGFPGHEHIHPTGGLICFNCGISLEKYIQSEKERLLKRVEEIVKDETKYETQSSLENIFIKINRIKEALKKEQ